MTTPPSLSRKQNRATHIVIDRAALAHNLAMMRAMAPTANVMAVIKADAYGHGMEIVAEALSQTLGEADEFGVSNLDDVRRLRAHGIDRTITMLSPQLDIDELNSLADLNVRTVFYDYTQLSLFNELDSAANLDLWLKVDTGMGRLGIHPDELPAVYSRLVNIDGICSLSLMSHLASADDPQQPGNKQQLNQFEKMANRFDFKHVSLLNSAGVVSFSDAAHDFIRPGLLLYGISPTKNVGAHTLSLKPVMSFNSELISIKRMTAGSTIGYGGRYTLDRDSRVGIVAVGYGDGYPRHAPSGTPVLINNMLVPLIGRVSMDMIAVDLGDIPANVGDSVNLWGEGNPIEEIAEAAGTIAYELACSISSRVERLVV